MYEDFILEIVESGIISIPLLLVVSRGPYMTASNSP